MTADETENSQLEPRGAEIKDGSQHDIKGGVGGRKEYRTDRMKDTVQERSSVHACVYAEVCVCVREPCGARGCMAEQFLFSRLVGCE